MKKKFYLLMASIILLSLQLKAQSPNQLNYQGVARNSAGTVIPNQSIGLRFTIHQGSNSGTSVYQETQTAMTNQFGLFTVAIGNGTVVSGTFATIGWGINSEYLQVEMDPTGGTSYTDMGTTQLLSVPYALYAAKSGVAVNSQWVTTGNNIYNKNSGSVGIGTTTPSGSANLDVETNHLFGGQFVTDSDYTFAAGVYGVFNPSGSTNDGYGVEGYSYPSDGHGIGGDFVGGWEGIYAEGYGTTNGYEYLGGDFGATSNGGYAYGVSSYAYDDGSGTAYGVYSNGATSSGIGYGVYGIGAPVGTYGYASGTGISYIEMGTTYGSETHVDGAIGEVDGSSGSNTTTINDGVLGIAVNTDANDNIGSWGYATGATGNNYGGYFVGQSTGSNYYTISMFGDINPDGNTSLFGDYAGYFNGNVEITGSISKGSGTFKIDDPLDPANKFLYHSFVESPDMMNVYNGNTTTDANGDAAVTLPAYFQVENKDFKYQLTVIGQFAQAIVATEISNNQFTIKTDKPNVKVSWQVTGVRQDPYANDHRVVAEVEKKGIEKGHYLYPQYYGQPKTMSISYLVSAAAHEQNIGTLRKAITPAEAKPKKSNGTTKTTN